MGERTGKPTRRTLAPVIAWLVWGALALGVSVVVSVWALSPPERDPVTAALSRLSQEAATFADRLWPDARDEAPRDEAALWAEAAFAVADGDPAQGRRLVTRYGCGACHTIPGIPRARGSVGPTLAGFRDQSYIAGILPNRPGALVDWLQSPPRHAPDTVMPDMGVSEAEAEHMAAYLYTLERR